MMRSPRLAAALRAASLLVACLALRAAAPEDFKDKDIDKFWKEIAEKRFATKPSRPILEKLSERQALKRLTGAWNSEFGAGPDRIVIRIGADHSAVFSGTVGSAAWTKTGSWRVVSDKLVVFLKEDPLPLFIFMTRRGPRIFDPWAETYVSDMLREL